MTNQADEIYFVFDVLQNRFQYINDAFVKITKRNRQVLINVPKLLVKLIHHEDLAYVKKSFKHKLTEMIENISKRKIDLIETLLTREFLATAAVEISLERLDVVWEGYRNV